MLKSIKVGDFVEFVDNENIHHWGPIEGFKGDYAIVIHNDVQWEVHLSEVRVTA